DRTFREENSSRTTPTSSRATHSTRRSSAGGRRSTAPNRSRESTRRSSSRGKIPRKGDGPSSPGSTADGKRGKAASGSRRRKRRRPLPLRRRRGKGSERDRADLRPPQAGRGATRPHRGSRHPIRAPGSQGYRDETRPGEPVPRGNVLRRAQGETVL